MNEKLNPEQIGSIIRSLRNEKGVSQEQMAQALDIPRSAISQIENEGRELSFLEFQKVLNLFQISFDEFIAHGNPQSKSQKSVQKNINKKIEFQPEKFKQLLLYILEKCGSKPNVGETVLYKLLYFCDFNFFELYEKPLTGMKYKKMQYGPVPEQSSFASVIKEMRDKGVIERVTRKYINNTIQTRYVNFLSADLSIFGVDTDKVIKVADAVIGNLSSMSARQIEDHSHADYPWQSSKFDEEIDYSTVFSRTGEFAQKDYDELWQQAAANDILNELGEMSEEENEYYLNLLKKND